LGIFINFKFKIKKIFSTGGPPCAHVLSGVLAGLFSIRWICEFQDPQFGKFIINPRSREVAENFYKFYKKYASKIIFVTDKAAQEAKKNSNKDINIKGIYPGSWDFIKRANTSRYNQNKNREIIHLGTLYSSRNLDNLFKALDKFKRNNLKDKKVQSIKIINCGDIYLNNKNSYIERKDFKLLKCKSRIEGIKRASRSNILLLVQHNDWRSEETIPYKFYDYLNLKMPILAITNNKELDSLVLKAGGIVANADSVDSIYKAFDKLFRKGYKFEFDKNDYLEIDIKKQFLKALD